MSKLKVKRGAGEDASVVRIENGKIRVGDNTEVSELVKDFTDMEIMVGKEPPGEDDTPAEELKPANDDEIANKLVGVIRENGYGVKRLS